MAATSYPNTTELWAIEEIKKVKMNWTPTEIWKNIEVFIIGGGASLRGFDWARLKKEPTIGCNNAFRLGPEVCDICIFGDKKFIFTSRSIPRKGYYDELEKFPNPIVSTDKFLWKQKIPWVTVLERKAEGFAINKLGWNMNTGSVAINLALVMGAQIVYLLGFDMHLDAEGRPNWHDFVIDTPKAEVYHRMIRGFEKAAPILKEIYPTRSVINVTNNSDLNVFPKINFDEFWKTRI